MVLLLLVPAAQAEIPSEFYIETATAVAAKMDAFAVSSLVEFTGSRAEIVALANEYGSAACHEPDRVLVCAFERGAYITKMTFGLNVAGGLGLTNDEYAMILERITPATLVAMTASKMGIDLLTINASCGIGKSYLAPEDWAGDALVLLMREGADVLVACSFIETGDGILTVSAAYLPVQIGREATIDALADLTGAAFTEIEIE